MNAPPGSSDGDNYYNFDDLFGTGQHYWHVVDDLGGPVGEKEGEQIETVTMAILDRMIVTVDPPNRCVVLCARDGKRLDKPGYGVVLTVAQASHVVALIRQCIARIEQIPPPPPADAEVPPLDTR
jgi:hypothetical protein